MGYDYVDDSGYPMDGIELDSSSSTAPTANSSRAGNSSSTRPYSPTSPHYGPEIAGNSSSGVAPSSPAYGPQPAPTTMNNTIESTTSDTTAPKADNQTKNSDSKPTANSSSHNSKQQQQNQAQEKQERHVPANDLVADYEEDDISDPANDLTNNEAMTMEDDNDVKSFKKSRNPDILKMLGTWGNDSGRNQRQQHTDRWATMTSVGAGTSSLFPSGNQATAANNTQNQSDSSDQAARSFGDLFDDDDLD